MTISLSRHKRKNFRRQLLAWYETNHRRLPWRETRDPYRIWISEVMLQQTQVATVIPYYFRFLDMFPTIKDLAAADLEQVLKMWEGLGYYARARNFHKAARIVAFEKGGKVPDSLEAFTALPGVGDYIGAAVQSIAFGHAFAVVDGNVKRVLARLFCDDTMVNLPAAHKQFKKHADTLLDRHRPSAFNQAVMELGALVCVPAKPKCGICPVAQYCCAQIRHLTEAYPKRRKTKKVPTHQIAVGVIVKNGKVLITRRKLDGLLGGLWEFPGGKLKKGETAEAACAREILEETGLTIRIGPHLTRVNHAYTHFKINMDIFLCRAAAGRVRLNGPIDFKWVTLKELDRFAFPKANLKFIPMLLDSDLS